MADARTDLTRVIREVTDAWEEPLDEVHDVPQIVNAVLAHLPLLSTLAQAWTEGYRASVWEEQGGDRQTNPYHPVTDAPAVVTLLPVDNSPAAISERVTRDVNWARP